ncbi:Ydr279p protein family (RNase H2 complex component) wHTH domain [Phytophthora infestans]|uniref:Ydr279p protein family (RNase H2 complex component) wHTH domain n=1 Tax=Phytophthora infestans TaxID=4787 RepID=A0A833TUL9_PHYIN|nr:Ydr279p protein family (RNase H2 complex component) wHTH domain [Phytophthora infestans]
MGRKLLALVPSELPSSVNLGRFHSDATDAPLLSVALWTSRPTAESTRTRQLALDKSKCQLLELQKLQPVEGARSWFVGNSVLQDGGLMVFSPVDALFVLLDAAWGQRTRFSSVYDLLARDGNTWLLQLTTLRSETIEKICDLQAVGDEEGVDNLFVQANESKVTSWLSAKVEKVAAVLAKQELDANAKAAAVDDQVNLPGYEKKETSSTVTQEDVARHYREAIDIVGNYLASDWIDVLCDKFRVNKVVEVKVVAKAAPQDTFKRFDRRQTPENGSKRPTPSTAASAKKKSKLASVDRTGMKSLTSFFGKK